MTKFYSKTTGGFFPQAMQSDYIAAGTWPSDAAPTTDAEETAIRAGLALGGAISGGPGAWFVTPAAPPPLAGVKAALAASVDDSISVIYGRFQRFTEEYVAREAAARAFKASGYTGTPDLWIMAFATPAGKTATQATDIIIGQADALKAVLSTLGGLRMRKYEIAAAVDATTAQAIRDDILTKVQAAAVGL